MTEIIAYMNCSVIENKLVKNIQPEDRYFNIKIQNKEYPSCYHYNVLVMLAKRLIKEEEINNKSKERLHWNKSLPKCIASA